MNAGTHAGYVGKNRKTKIVADSRDSLQICCQDKDNTLFHETLEGKLKKYSHFSDFEVRTHPRLCLMNRNVEITFIEDRLDLVDPISQLFRNFCCRLVLRFDRLSKIFQK